MNRLVTYLFDSKKQTKEVSWFRSALYLFIVYKIIIYLIQFNDLFSNKGLVFHQAKHINVIVDLVFYLNNHYSIWLSISFIALAFLTAVLGLFKKGNYITNFVLWFVIMNLTAFLYPTLTAGDYLLNQLLFFNIFFNGEIASNKIVNDLKICLHNLALTSIKIQICFACFIASYYKLLDPSWTSGLAIYQTFQIPEFSNAFLSMLPFNVCMVLTYFTIAYQLLFSVLVWFRPFKIYLFSFGILQHLLIAFGMGLFQFGIIMIICYILFLKYDYPSVNNTASKGYSE